MRIKRFIASIMSVCIIVSLFQVYVFASMDIEVWYNSQRYTNGSSLHYTDDNVNLYITCGMEGFDIYINGAKHTYVSGIETNISLNLPSGPTTIETRKDGVGTSSVIINFYKDTVVDPGAALTYYSYAVQVTQIGNYKDVNFIVGYDGAGNTGIVKSELNTEVSRFLPDLSAGNYIVKGTIYVKVFSNGNWVGDYDTKSGDQESGSGYSNLYDYNWGAVEYELRQRANWQDTVYIEPKPVEKGSFTVRHKDNSTHAEIAPESIVTDLTLPTSKIASINSSISGYKSSPTSYIKWAGREDMANDQIKQPFSSPVSIGLDSTNPDGFVYYFYDKIPPTKGRINIVCINIDTGVVISGGSTESELNLGSYTRSYNPISGTTFAGSNKTYTSTPPSISSRDTNARSQTVTLTDTNKEAWIWFYYKGAAPTPSPTPTPTPDPNKPPVADIIAPDIVLAGDDVYISSNSYDPDGTIVKHEWECIKAKIPITGYSTTTWFEQQGDFSIYLRVTDNKGAADSASKPIKVLPPIPKAIIDTKGRLKENYKITVDATKSIGSKRYPIDFTKTNWEITAVSGCTQEDIKYHGNLTGMAQKDFLVKKAGKIKITLTVTNILSQSNTIETFLDIAPNLPPVAQLIVPKRSIRENIDAYGQRYGETIIYDTSYSPDGDKVIMRSYFCRYDSNNDGDFEDEVLDKFYEGPDTQAVKRYYNDQGVGWCRYDIEIEEDLMERDTNGNYINTIPEFILPEDIKRANTFYIQ